MTASFRQGSIQGSSTQVDGFFCVAPVKLCHQINSSKFVHLFPPSRSFRKQKTCLKSLEFLQFDPFFSSSKKNCIGICAVSPLFVPRGDQISRKDTRSWWSGRPNQSLFFQWVAVFSVLQKKKMWDNLTPFNEIGDQILWMNGGGAMKRIRFAFFLFREQWDQSEGNWAAFCWLKFEFSKKVATS